MRKETIESINKRLEVIIALLLRARIKESETLTRREQIRILSDLGLSPREIANILGRSVNYINKEISKLRSEARKVKK